jgi:mRNA interferase MazF
VVVRSQLKCANAPRNALLTPDETGLPRPSVANVTQVVTLGKAELRDRTGRLAHQRLEEVLSGLGLGLGRR